MLSTNYSLVYHSCAIEGCSLTELETKLLLEARIVPKTKPAEHVNMVRDHFDSLVFILETAKRKKSVSVKFIQELNGKVMRGTGTVRNTILGAVDVSSGAFFKGNVSAGGRYFLSYDKVEASTKKLVEEINVQLLLVGSIREILVLSFTAHYKLVNIHPFYDGNGRTARLLMNYIQAFHGLPLVINYCGDREDYYAALQETRKKENVEPFHEFMFGQYEKLLLHEIQQFKNDLGKEKRIKKNQR